MQASARLSSSAASKKVIAGVSSAITRSCYRTSRGKAHAAPPPKGQKRISKQERRFRASNDGKFPSVTNVRQQVGGSHYTVREVLQELEYNHMKLPLGSAKAAPLEGTVEVSEHSRPKDEIMVDQLQGTPEFAELSRPKDDIVKNPYNCDNTSQEINDVLISQKDAATSTGIVEKTEAWKSVGSSPHNVETVAAKYSLNTPETFKAADDPNLSHQTESENMKVITTETWKSVGSSHHNVETEAANYSLNTSETFKAADDPNLSHQTESENMKVITNKSSVSLGVEAKSNPGNQQSETEPHKLALKSTEKIPNARESSVSDQSGSDKVIEADIHDREHKPKHEPEESTSTGLFGSLKSFAYGIRSFWKKL